jgi:hypothetical protein
VPGTRCRPWRCSRLSRAGREPVLQGLGGVSTESEEDVVAHARSPGHASKWMLTGSQWTACTASY